MIIKYVRIKKPLKYEPFGEISSQDLGSNGREWYFGDNRIGIKFGSSREEGLFNLGFLVEDFGFVIINNPKYPEIRRDDRDSAKLISNGENPRNMKRLVDLILSQKLTFVFPARLTQDDERGFLTFSKTEPDVNLHGICGIILKTEYSSRIDELFKKTKEGLKNFVRGY